MCIIVSDVNILVGINMTNDESVRTIIIEPFLRIYVQVATDTTTVYQQGAIMHIKGDY
jgi:hypothetical protein